MFRGKRITVLFAAVLVCMVMPAFAGNGMTFAADTIAKVTVNEADAALPPLSPLPSGLYSADQVIILQTQEEGGTTYVTTDGSDPVSNGAKYTDGEQIRFCRDDLKTGKDGLKTVTVKAYTKKAGKQPSNIVTYEYTFDNNIPVPTGEELYYNGQPQVGLYDKCFYTI